MCVLELGKDKVTRNMKSRAPYLFSHHFRVSSINKDWMGVPTQAKLSVFIAGLNVGRIIGIFRLSPLDVQCNADLAVLRGGKFIFICPVCLGMSSDFIVGANVCIVSYARNTRCSISVTITSSTLNSGLI